MELVHASSYSDRSRDGARKQAAIFPFFPFRFTHYLTCDLFGGGRKVLTAKLNREIVGMVVELGGVPGDAYSSGLAAFYSRGADKKRLVLFVVRGSCLQKRAGGNVSPPP